MDKEVILMINSETFEFNEMIEFESGKQLRSDIVILILTYLYGERKTIEHISKHCNIHHLRCLHYLNCLKENAIIKDEIIQGNHGMLETYYFVDDMQAQAHVIVKQVDEILNYVQYFSNHLREILFNLAESDDYQVTLTFAELTEADVKHVSKMLKDLHTSMDGLENSENQDGDKQKLSFLSAFGRVNSIIG